MKTSFVKVSLRQMAVFVEAKSSVGTQTTAANSPSPLGLGLGVGAKNSPLQWGGAGGGVLKATTSNLVANLAKLGYGVSEPLLWALNETTPKFQLDLLNTFREVMGVNKNWTPLVKGWDEPTGENVVDHIMTFFANVFGARGVRLQCGHVIPDGTFPLERYNGCPYCGTPFEFGKLEKIGQGSKLKVLELWTEKELHAFFEDLLTSKTALDATQIDSLKMLLAELPVPEVKIGMKETLMTIIDTYIEQNQADKAQALFASPTDILRYLWYKHTGFLQIIEPKTIIKRKNSNAKTLAPLISVGGLSLGTKAKATGLSVRTQTMAALKLKYNRKQGLMVAKWLNNLPMDIEKICEAMHPKRQMWVRFIRALRLAEYSKRTGFGKLKEILDVFYNEVYEVWQGRVNHYRLKVDEENTFKLLKQRPGMFARSLFANMLWFGAENTIAAFAEVIDKVPARLVFTLNMYAENYFTKSIQRSVKPLGGVSKRIAPHALLDMYEDEALESMKQDVAYLCLLAMKNRFEKIANDNKTMYIDPMLYKMPVSIGDRSETVQDLPSALQGTRFPVEGDTIRLFMQWGEGLPAQHLDMDLSAWIAYNGKSEICSYSNLVATGCKHSGDIRSIPNKVGTAEYIEININELRKAKAKYVTFTCNAYILGEIVPNLVVGWMNSKFPMKISETTGVAYDPSCVQHQVRVTQGLTKGLVFGVLDVEAKEVVWLEMPFAGQIVQNLDFKGVKALLAKLDNKLSIGNLLAIKAEAQNLALVTTPEEADEIYTQTWGMNVAGVTKLLVD
ncbi:MAG: hypothetical protein MUE81_08695 [Thermoflexibacter sp.]|jgi:hypothetical protein|nr:hypothetical protein [Thermoflexibacter sp.]